ncbi:MAG TPA: 50S ribosomal protein L19, partial [Elusimicrobia bacterium]|nr:50S ribosomal protein L19 [Elusimicrobiota bacterium]
AKLYYLRELTGRAARLTEEEVRGAPSAAGAEPSPAAEAAKPQSVEAEKSAACA